MLDELDLRSSSVGLKINYKKTEYIRSEGVPIGRLTVGGDEIEEVSSYVYLSQEATMRREEESEITRRVRADSRAFNLMKDVLKTNLRQLAPIPSTA